MREPVEQLETLYRAILDDQGGRIRQESLSTYYSDMS